MAMTKDEISAIIKENNVRMFEFTRNYNPLTGDGSPIPRVQLHLTPTSSVGIPTYLAETDVFKEIMSYPTIYHYAKASNMSREDIVDFINSQRIKYDFEFWAVTCCTIIDKITGKPIPFILRKPQRKLLEVYVRQLFIEKKPVRVKLLKARQWGGSTLTQMFMAWIQLFHKENWHSVIAAHLNNASRIIRHMYDKMVLFHPKDVVNVEMRNFENSQTTKIIPQRGCRITIGSAETPDSLRSDDLKLAHLSEVGLWQDNPKIKGDDLAQSIIASVPDILFTMIVLESTAKGIGNYFYRTWIAENIFEPVFVAWFETNIYQKKFPDHLSKINFIKSMTAEEWERWNLGATLEGLNWYRDKKNSMPSDFRMRQEFPSTPQEAFATTARNVHNASDIEFLRGGCRPADFVGTLVATAQYDNDAFDNLHFVNDKSGDLWLWAMPDKERNITDRYIVSMDIGGRSDDADWTVLSVIDRVGLLFGGCEECIGTWKFHIDQDLAAWRAAQLAKFYNDALLVVEFNSLDTIGSEGDYSYTILDQIVNYYPNIYFRDDPTKVKEGLAPHYGFYTGRKEKVDIVVTWQRALRDKLIIERDSRVLDECQWFEQKDKRDTYGAIEGQHDDMYMSRGIGLKVSSTMPLPVEIQRVDNPNYRQSTIRTSASF